MSSVVETSRVVRKTVGQSGNTNENVGDHGSDRESGDAIDRSSSGSERDSWSAGCRFWVGSLRWNDMTLTGDSGGNLRRNGGESTSGSAVITVSQTGVE